ncbi:MAG: YqjD family protein [Steroidobacterales bacterium]
METTADDFKRATPRSIKSAAREAAQQAGAAAGEEVQNLIADVEDLMDRVGDAADPEIRRLRAKVADAITTAKKSIADGVEQVQGQANQAIEASDRYVRNQPWEAIGIAALAGLAVGFLVSRR